MTEKDYKTACRMITYDKIKMLRDVEHQSIQWIADHLGLNFRTVKKYLHMDRSEFEAFSESITRKPFILEPYKDFIVHRLGLYQDTPAAQMHDWLKEHYPDFPDVSPKTVYNYVMKLRSEYNLPKVTATERAYQALPQTPPGAYAQVDFGRKKLRSSDGAMHTVHFMVMLLCHSRQKYLYFQDKPFTSESAVIAHEKAFDYFKGIPKHIIYDQDAVFLYDENIGDYKMTEVFAGYVKSRPFTVIFCRPADPESKGKVENAVKYVKQNFLLNRQFSTLNNLQEEAVSWLGRTGNMMVHGTTCRIPYEEWCKECKDLFPYTPVTSIPAATGHKVLKTNSIKYRDNTYSVPLGTYKDETTRVLLEEIKGDLIIMDMDGKEIARAIIPAGTGNIVINKNHYRNTSVKISERMEEIKSMFSDSETISAFLMEVRARYPRYLRDQLATIQECVFKYGRAAADAALALCIRNRLYSANDFKAFISSNNAVISDGTLEIKTLGDESARMIANFAPGKSSIDTYEGVWNI
ncbi:MAG: IS21 family transposase [Candidatus Cryptobacteroides sp.]|jgi:hypothetical protein